MKNKKVLYIAIPVVAVLAVIALALVFFGSERVRTDVQASTLGEYIPADADTAVITPSGGEWWNTLGSFAPILFDLKANQPKSDLPISYYGYSRSLNHNKDALAGTGPLQLVYLESPTPEDAASVLTWLRSDLATDDKGMNVKTIKNVNIVSYSWATVELEKTTSPISSDPLFTGEVPMIWMNYDKMTETLKKPAQPIGSSDAPSVGVGEDDSPDIASVIKSATGITSGTVWRATSKDNGASWGGTFVAGGIDKSQINPKKAQEIAASSGKVLLEDSSQTAVTGVGMRLLTVGLTPFQGAFGLKYDGIDGKFGNASNDLSGLSSVPNQIVSGTSGIGTNVMDMTMQDSGSSPSGIGSSQISASETEMNVKFNTDPAVNAPQK